jgi:hypothetical protein
MVARRDVCRWSTSEPQNDEIITRKIVDDSSLNMFEHHIILTHSEQLIGRWSELE